MLAISFDAASAFTSQGASGAQDGFSVTDVMAAPGGCGCVLTVVQRSLQRRTVSPKEFGGFRINDNAQCARSGETVVQALALGVIVDGRGVTFEARRRRVGEAVSVHTGRCSDGSWDMCGGVLRYSSRCRSILGLSTRAQAQRSRTLVDFV